MSTKKRAGMEFDEYPSGYDEEVEGRDACSMDDEEEHEIFDEGNPDFIDDESGEPKPLDEIYGGYSSGRSREDPIFQEQTAMSAAEQEDRVIPQDNDRQLDLFRALCMADTKGLQNAIKNGASILDPVQNPKTGEVLEMGVALIQGMIREKMLGKITDIVDTPKGAKVATANDVMQMSPIFRAAETAADVQIKRECKEAGVPYTEGDDNPFTVQKLSEFGRQYQEAANAVLSQAEKLKAEQGARAQVELSAAQSAQPGMGM